MFLVHLKTSTKLWLGVALIVSGLFGVIGFATYRAAQVQARSDQQESEFSFRMVSATQWRGLTEANAARTLAVVLSTDAALSNEFKTPIASTTAQISSLQKSIEQVAVGEADRAQLQKVAAARKHMIELREQVLKLKSNGKPEESLALARGAFRDSLTQYIASLDEFVSLQQAQTKQSQQEVQAQRDTTLKIAGGLVVLIVFGILLGARVLIRSIVSPLARANRLAARIAEGDLSSHLQVDREDEFGELLRSLQAMSTALGEVVGRVRQSTDNIALASSEIAAGNNDLSIRTEQTSSNLQQSASALDHLTVNLQQSAQSAQQASRLANTASSVAQKGGAVVGQVVDTMQAINDSSKRIADIVGLIDSIAFQTNILALNAAVEAARAGEQGRGFAVVASEVRSLAQRSAAAAREIKTLIQASVERVELGTQQVSDAGGTMNEIVTSVQQVSEMIASITAAANAQSADLASVNQSVASLDQMTQQNAALVEQSAAAAQSLREHAEQLAAVVHTFKIKAEAGGVTAVKPPAVKPPSSFKAGPAPRPVAKVPVTVPASSSNQLRAPVSAASAHRLAAAPVNEGAWENF